MKYILGRWNPERKLWDTDQRQFTFFSSESSLRVRDTKTSEHFLLQLLSTPSANLISTSSYFFKSSSHTSLFVRFETINYCCHCHHPQTNHSIATTNLLSHSVDQTHQHDVPTHPTTTQHYGHRRSQTTRQSLLRVLLQGGTVWPS